MKALYVDTSAVLRILLEVDTSLVPHVRDAERRFTSALTQVEIDRSLLRSRLCGRIDPQREEKIRLWLGDFYSGLEVIALDAVTLRGAGRRFPIEPVRALDAIHLASAQRLEGRFSSLVVASHDNRLRANAGALGFALLPPVSSAAS